MDELEIVSAFFRDHPHYYTDGKRYHANPSHRKAKGLRYVGRFRNAKEARAFDQETTGAVPPRGANHE